MTPKDILTLALVDWHALRIARAWRKGDVAEVQRIREELSGNYGVEGLHIIEDRVPDQYLLLVKREE